MRELIVLLASAGWVLSACSPAQENASEKEQSISNADVTNAGVNRCDKKYAMTDDAARGIIALSDGSDQLYGDSNGEIARRLTSNGNWQFVFEDDGSGGCQVRFELDDIVDGTHYHIKALCKIDDSLTHPWRGGGANEGKEAISFTGLCQYGG